MSEPFNEESFFDFKCPYCTGVNSFPTSAAHTLQECSSCSETIIVPENGAAIARVIPLPIVTKRLIIRQFTHDDSRSLMHMLATDNFLGLAIDETKIYPWIESQITARFTRGDTVHFAIQLAENQKLIGVVHVNFADHFRYTSGFTLTIAKTYRRQGLALEAVNALIDFSFDGLCSSRVALTSGAHDQAACGLLKKAGMRQEGEFLKSLFNGEDWVNELWFAMLKEERPSRR